MDSDDSIPGAVDHATGSVAPPVHPDLQRVLAYWHAKRGTRAFPQRNDIDPTDLRFVLGRIALAEVHDGEAAGSPRRYRLRLVGSWWHTLLGLESTGVWVDEWPMVNQARLTTELYEALIADRRPRVTHRNDWVDEKQLDYEIIALPLSEDGARISMIMTAIGPDKADWGY